MRETWIDRRLHQSRMAHRARLNQRSKELRQMLKERYPMKDKSSKRIARLEKEVRRLRKEVKEFRQVLFKKLEQQHAIIVKTLEDNSFFPM